MILRQIQDYIQNHGQASPQDISRHFDLEPGVVESILDTLAQKGRVRRLAVNKRCSGGCQRCAPATGEVYVWLGGQS